MDNDSDTTKTTSGDESESSKVVNFLSGSPGELTLKGCSKILRKATESVLHDGCNMQELFAYGPEGGDEAFREQVAQFLSKEYGGDKVEKERLLMNAGATQGLYIILTILVPSTSPVFVIDPTYFLCLGMIEKDLQRTSVPVPSDSEGPIMAAFEELVKKELEKCGGRDAHSSSGQPYWAAVYLIPTFNNPTGISYSPDKCRQLIALARRYNLLMVTEDVYNLIYFTEPKDLPRRMVTFDLPSDPDYGKGHVLSNGTFSKILAPGLRVGWIEGPKEIIFQLSDSFVSWSGGAFNHYSGKLITQIIASGQLSEHLTWLRAVYKENMTSLCDVLDKHATQDWSYDRPQGGFFLWIRVRPEVDTTEFLAFCKKHYRITFIPGIRTSPTKSYTNYIRLSASYHDKATLCTGAETLCRSFRAFLTEKGLVE